MRAVRKAIPINWRLFVVVYVGSLLLAWAFGWAGLCAAFAIAVFLLRHVPAFLLRRVERWYFDDDVRGLVEAVDTDDAGGAA